jgi:hypothetical protein
MRRKLPNPEFCHANEIPGTNLADCLVESPSSCRYALSFGHGYLCKNPDRQKFRTLKGSACEHGPISKLAAQIILHVRSSEEHDFSEWHVGTMQDIDRCYVELNRPLSFNFWRTDSLLEARENTGFLVKKMGMKLLNQTHLDVAKKSYVYIFHRAR